jgi:hypothetical protein
MHAGVIPVTAMLAMPWIASRRVNMKSLVIQEFLPFLTKVWSLNNSLADSPQLRLPSRQYTGTLQTCEKALRPGPGTILLLQKGKKPGLAGRQ